MLSPKDLEPYIKVEEFKKKNNLKNIDSLAKSLMVVKDENGDERKFYSLSSAVKFIGVSIATMHYIYNNHRTRIK